MSNTNYTLFKTSANNQTNDYQLQITTDFDTANYAMDGSEIIQPLPTSDGDWLRIKLKFKQGTDSHIVHDFSIGNFPLNIANWILEVEYVNEAGIKIKDTGQTAQAEIEARPRPVNAFNK